MKNVAEKNCIQNQDPRFIIIINYFENRVFYGIKWKKFCTAGQTTDYTMAHAHCMLNIKATKTYSENVVFIAFTLQQRLRERASMLRSTYISRPAFLWCCSP